jgi:hypothetical protein
MNLAEDCVQHKWCLLAQSCGMEAEVKQIVQAKMHNILQSVKENADDHQDKMATDNSILELETLSSSSNSSGVAPTSPTCWQPSPASDSEGEAEKEKKRKPKLQKTTVLL